ncbi:MAG TPA: TldD/PmbA family protein, partial [Polyangia bacterium]|nr:TldD/PmbA family protein [Polyangia bacterium]
MIRPKILLSLAALLFAAHVRADVPPLPPTTGAGVILEAMHSELERAHARLRLKGYEAPYFIAYSVRDYEQHEISGRFGAVVTRSRGRSRQAYVEVRVGDYQLDNTSSDRESAFDVGDPDGYEPPTEAPLDDDGQALRGTLWLLTDEKYKQALSAYAKKRGRRATTVVEDENLPSFSREPPARHADPPVSLAFDENALSERVRKASALFKTYPDLFDATVKITADRVTRYFVNSEGSQVIGERTIYSAHLAAATRAKDGMLLEHEKDFYGRDGGEMPDDAALAKSIALLATELRALRDAPVIDPYTGPALLMEEAAGVFFHETVGHRLEGERQNDEKEGRTFKGQVGKRVLPEFLSVVDDPTVRAAGGVSLNGYYTFDDEGVPARTVTLIEGGVLRDYIKSRTPIVGSLHSNGHGRAEGTADPMGRMANLFVRSKRKVSVAKLKEMLLEEVRRQGKPFGLIITDITGGSTNTTNYGYQAFKGQPRLVYRVDAKTGAETLVRGVEMVGTPLTTVSKIVATSDTEGVFNGFCGAESGFVPVSTVAPAVL